MGIESKNLDGSAPNPIPSGHQTWLAEKNISCGDFPLSCSITRGYAIAKTIYICTFWYFGLPIWIL